MMKEKLYRLITTGLIVTLCMGSVGTTVSAAEADTASTDIIMLSEDSGNDSEDAEKPEEELDSAKETTIEALPTIIEYYQSRGYSFEALDRNTQVFHHNIAN